MAKSVARLVLPAAFVGCSHAAWAAGGRGLELSGVSDWDGGVVYLVALLASTAWAFGVRNGIPFRRALVWSAAAWALGGLFAGLVCFFVPHSVQNRFGGDLNPDPLLRALVGSAILSVMLGVVGSLVWWDAVRRGGRRVPGYRLFPECVAIYGLLVFGNLGVQLLRPRPYGGLERQVAAERKGVREAYIVVALESYLEVEKHYPEARNYDELTEALREYIEPVYRDDPCLWAAAYEPRYSRFARGDDRGRKVIEWNPAASSKGVGSLDWDSIWLLCDAATRKRMRQLR